MRYFLKVYRGHEKKSKSLIEHYLKLFFTVVLIDSSRNDFVWLMLESFFIIFFNFSLIFSSNKGLKRQKRP